MKDEKYTSFAFYKDTHYKKTFQLLHIYDIYLFSKAHQSWM